MSNPTKWKMTNVALKLTLGRASVSPKKSPSIYFEAVTSGENLVEGWATSSTSAALTAADHLVASNSKVEQCEPFMTSKRVKLISVKCSKCKADLLVKPTERICPVCGNQLPEPVKR